MKKVLLIAILMFTGIENAKAQVALEGSASYRMNGTGSRISTEGSVSRAVNYNNYHIYGARVILGITKDRYTEGRSLNGTTIASSTVNNMAPRTAYQDVRFSGITSVRARGSFNVVLLLIDDSSRIKAGLNFRKKVSFGQPSFRRSLKRSYQKALLASKALKAGDQDGVESFWQGEK